VRRCVVCLPAFWACALTSAGLAGATTLPGFHSPSGNIKCLFVPGARYDSGGHGPSTMLCEIAHANYAKRLQDHCMGPIGAGVDWHGFDLTQAGKGGISCSGGFLDNPESQNPSYGNLPYGTSWRKGVFACRSRTSGVTCTNREGHGLFISRQSWRTW